jgi:hypothetical protein
MKCNALIVQTGAYARRLVTSMLIKKIQYSVHLIFLQYSHKDVEAGEDIGRHALSM